jgi:DNA-binding NtrC family response regulator
MSLPSEVEPEVAFRQTCRGPLLASHKAMRDLLAVLDRVAGSSCTVLVTGESGTGKELAIAALHDASPRRSARLVAVNCGAIAENLIESELFGHARGAFTGAHGARQGLVAAAEGGTLFLDEVGELPLAAQVKLLRLLQAREYTPVGESRAIKANVRIVAATNRDLAKEVQAGRFREDLYYRLNVIHVRLPSLRERREDVPLLAMHFLRAAVAREPGSTVVAFSPEAMARLVAEPWPGNVRELENVVERAVLLSPDPIVAIEWVADLQTESTREVAEPVVAVLPMIAPTACDSSEAECDDDGADGELAAAMIDLRAEVDAYENNLIRKAMRLSGNNKTKAAQSLGLHRTTFVEMLKRKRLVPLPRAA